MKTIVILHGWQGRQDRWQPLIKILRRRYQVLSPPLPGFKSELKKPWNTKDYAKWLKSYLKKHNLRQVALIGHSFGGQIATEFTATNPNFVQKLILIDSAGLRPKVTLKKVTFGIMAKIGKILFIIPPLIFIRAFARKMLYKAAQEGDYFKASPMMRRTLKKIVKDDQRHNFTLIQAPTLIIWGKKDSYTPLKHGQITHQLINGSILKVISHARHSPQFTHTKKVSEYISKFITS